jgi:hypothetical protein
MLQDRIDRKIVCGNHSYRREVSIFFDPSKFLADFVLVN